jgi:hypothetical protein
MQRLYMSGAGRLRMIALLAVLGFVACATTIPQTSEGETTPTAVTGYIYDSGYNPVEGANVTVTIEGPGGTPSTTYYYDESLSSGYYKVDFSSDDWEVGYTIDVTAKFGGDERTNSTVAVSGAFQMVNVTLLLTTIPEFGGLFGSSAALVVVVTIAMFIVIRRKKG